ncbi:MAG: AmpG family muropeptide MFS transporter [Rhodospirillales bacterium]|nr:AmpG family muropeptide MFS transporter [Rhodospirillales bacterium]
MNAWFDSLRVYREPRLLAVLFMGFSSGLPLPLTFGTLSFWLAEVGVSRTEIGLFALVGISYSFKFVWSPLIDRLPLPWATRALGRRRGWLIVIQILLALAIMALGATDPRTEVGLTALAAVFVAFLSASQDIVIDAYRIELLKPEEQGAGAAATQWGYRFGMMAASAGALYVADYAAGFGGWSVAYMVMALLMGVGMVTVLLTVEPAGSIAALAPPPGETAADRTLAWINGAVIAPFADFITRPGWLGVIVFIVLYKFGDALAGVMANPFYVAMGFSKIEVANISKVFGVFATLAGLAAGGLAVYRLGLYRSLLVCGILQAVSNLMYVAQSFAGHDPWMLTLTIFIENFTGGMGSAAFVAYLSSLCNIAFTATQYALLSSLATVGRTTLSASGGFLADQLDWAIFFTLTTVAAVPGVLMILWLMRRFPLPAAGAARKPALALDD